MTRDRRAPGGQIERDAKAPGQPVVGIRPATTRISDEQLGALQGLFSLRRGVAFLWRTQRDDGSWFVASRGRAFQLYFESGFPYGKDQFIAVGASGWAAAAQAIARPPTP
jgi:hypothetical protein